MHHILALYKKIKIASDFYNEYTQTLVVDNIGHYGIISHQPVEGLIKHISPHLAFRAALPRFSFFGILGGAFYLS